MNTPKIFLAAFFVSILVLGLVIYLQPSKSGEVISGTVESHTLTQSLDGHRRYLTVRTSSNERILIQSPTSEHCLEGYKVTFRIEQGLTPNTASYKFVSCSQ